MSKPSDGIAAFAAQSCLLMGVLCALSGCKFGKLTNAYIDHVDRKNDQCTLYLDHLYRVDADLTRAGKPDWCKSVPDFVAERTCYTREGARDVPVPGFVVYPQPANSLFDDDEDASSYGGKPTEDVLSPNAVPPMPAVE